MPAAIARSPSAPSSRVKAPACSATPSTCICARSCRRTNRPTTSSGQAVSDPLPARPVASLLLVRLAQDQVAHDPSAKRPAAEQRVLLVQALIALGADPE